MNPQPILKVNPNAGGNVFLQPIIESIQNVNFIEIGLGLLFSGITAIFLAGLYKRFSQTMSNHDSFARLFPLITITTTIVIYIVKSSLALSLGLVGALSIVRFRAAIKEPEELMYLFMCIAMGLGFGANMPAIAMLGLFFFTLFVCLYQYGNKTKKRQNLMLSLTTDTEAFFQETWEKIDTILSEECEKYNLQRAEMDNEQFQISAMIHVSDSATVVKILSRLKDIKCQVSYMNLDTMM